MMTATSSTVLAATGSDLAPWLIGAGIVIVLGAIALIIGQVVRSRRAAAVQTDAAASAGSAASVAGTGSDQAGAAGPGGGADGADSGPISPDEPR